MSLTLLRTQPSTMVMTTVSTSRPEQKTTIGRRLRSDRPVLEGAPLIYSNTDFVLMRTSSRILMLTRIATAGFMYRPVGIMRVGLGIVSMRGGPSHSAESAPCPSQPRECPLHVLPPGKFSSKTNPIGGAHNMKMIPVVFPPQPGANGVISARCHAMPRMP
jgi:hypothetical protein